MGVSVVGKDISYLVAWKHGILSDQCPITAVAWKHVYSGANVGSYDEAAATLGLRKEATKKILEAADCSWPTDLRNRLLRACHLAS